MNQVNCRGGSSTMQHHRHCHSLLLLLHLILLHKKTLPFLCTSAHYRLTWFSISVSNCSRNSLKLASVSKSVKWLLIHSRTIDATCTSTGISSTKQIHDTCNRNSRVIPKARFPSNVRNATNAADATTASIIAFRPLRQLRAFLAFIAFHQMETTLKIRS